MREFMAISRALADQTRVRLLLALELGELCVCQLIELVKLAPSTVSKHMAILRQARLVDARRDGRWMYYRLPGKEAPLPIRQAIRWARRALAEDSQILKDRKTLDTILKIDREELCRRRMRR